MYQIAAIPLLEKNELKNIPMDKVEIFTNIMEDHFVGHIEPGDDSEFEEEIKESILEIRRPQHNKHRIRTTAIEK